MIRRSTSIILAALAIAVFAGTAEARHHARHGSPSESAAGQDQAGQFDYYLLTLSWSPTYCLTHPQDQAQCGGKGFGFVLHGLWPQYMAGGYPQDCATQYRLTPEAVAFGKTIFPSPKLIDHEWGKHGTCSGLDALGYFKAADQGRTQIKVPAKFDSPAQTFSASADDIVSGFIAANPGMPAKAIAVSCSGPELAEVRICLDRNLSPIACGKGVKTTCNRPNIRIPAAH